MSGKASIHVMRIKGAYYQKQRHQKYLETSRIELIALPTYSPNLNLIEGASGSCRGKGYQQHLQSLPISNAPFWPFLKRFPQFKAGLWQLLLDLSLILVKSRFVLERV